MDSIRIGGASLNQIPLDWKNNTGNIVEAIREARKQQIRILCLPELCVTGYGCEDWFLSEWVPEKALEEIVKITKECEDITVSVGFPLRYKNRTYNAVCVISNKKILGITCKQFLARDGVHYEPRWFFPWPPYKVLDFKIGGETVSAGDVIYEVDGIRMGFEICEDAWHKNKRPGYRLRDRNVHLILNPSASHFAMRKSQLRETEVVIDGSRRFKCAYVFTNLLGNEAGRMIYDGDIIIGQCGKLLAVNKRLSFNAFNLLSCRVNFHDPDRSEIISSPDIKEVNEELTQALSLALFDYLRKSRAKGFVLSLSGGADSSSCAIFVAEMVRRASLELGWEKMGSALGLPPIQDDYTIPATVHKILACAYQGTKNSSEATFLAAKTLATSVGATFYHWNIDEEVNSYTQKIESATGQSLSWEEHDIALQNIQARSRSPIIWMLANLRQSVLLTTSNRSEGNVGYATMDGDTSGSLAPIAGLSKPFIIQWLKWAETTLGYHGLAPVNGLQPTAELRPQERRQTDEDDLMPYVILEEIERLAIYERQSPLAVYQEMNRRHSSDMIRGYVKKFFRLWAANQWKRERLAPSFHLDDLNVDPRTWCRFPILSSGFTDELSALDNL
jgi:NAD+ synthase (glutamine-hydrolysing)